MSRYLPDVNILVYAHRPEMAEHITAKHWLDAALLDGHQVLLLSQTIFGYLRLVTNVKIFPAPTALADAVAQMQALIKNPAVEVVHFSPAKLGLFCGVAVEAGAVAGGISDAYLAMVAMEESATLVSTDKGFSQYAKLQWINPFAEERK